MILTPLTFPVLAGSAMIVASTGNCRMAVNYDL